MKRWALLTVFAVILHALFITKGPTLSLIFQIKPARTPSIPIIWVTYLKEFSVEPPQTDNPLEHAQAITEDLLKETL